MVKKRRKMPLENPRSDFLEKNKSAHEHIEQNISEQNFIGQEVKTELLETNGTENFASTMCETILSNELDIKSEPEEQMDHSTQNDRENEKSDSAFG